MSRSFTRAVLVAALLWSIGAGAQTPPRPPDTSPPPLPDVGAEPDFEPQVTIIRKENETVEEVRVNGELKYVKVTPRGFRPYFLIPSGNGSTFVRSDTLPGGTSPAMWLLFSW